MTNSLEEIITNLQELKTMHRLNLELLEQLDVACGWLLDNHIPIPNESIFCSLLTKAKSLLTEMHSSEIGLVGYSKISRQKVTPFRTDEDETEPLKYRLNWLLQGFL